MAQTEVSKYEKFVEVESRYLKLKNVLGDTNLNFRYDYG